MANVVAAFAQLRSIDEQFERVEDFIEHTVCGRRIVLADVIADGVEIEVSEMGKPHEAHLAISLRAKALSSFKMVEAPGATGSASALRAFSLHHKIKTGAKSINFAPAKFKAG